MIFMIIFSLICGVLTSLLCLDMFTKIFNKIQIKSIRIFSFILFLIVFVTFGWVFVWLITMIALLVMCICFGLSDVFAHINKSKVSTIFK